MRILGARVPEHWFIPDGDVIARTFGLRRRPRDPDEEWALHAVARYLRSYPFETDEEREVAPFMTPAEWRPSTANIVLTPMRSRRTRESRQILSLDEVLRVFVR